MIFPIGDTQVRGGYTPYVSYGFIALNIVMFIIQMRTEGSLICELSAIPQDVIQGERYYTVLTSMFLHGGYMHIIGNMVFLWIFGDNIEATIGSLRFLFFYLLGGVISSLAHIYFESGTGDTLNCCVPCQNVNVDCGEGVPACQGFIPSLGASGAISAIMGAYMVMFPKSQIKILVLILFRSIYVSAWIFLAVWFGSQLLSGLGSKFNITGTGGVAWWAHIGGFVMGLLAGFLFKKYIEKESKQDFV